MKIGWKKLAACVALAVTAQLQAAPPAGWPSGLNIGVSPIGVVTLTWSDTAGEYISDTGLATGDPLAGTAFSLGGGSGLTGWVVTEYALDYLTSSKVTHWDVPMTSIGVIDDVHVSAPYEGGGQLPVDGADSIFFSTPGVEGLLNPGDGVALTATHEEYAYAIFAWFPFVWFFILLDLGVSRFGVYMGWLGKVGKD